MFLENALDRTPARVKSAEKLSSAIWRKRIFTGYLPSFLFSGQNLSKMYSVAMHIVKKDNATRLINLTFAITC